MKLFRFALPLITVMCTVVCSSESHRVPTFRCREAEMKALLKLKDSFEVDFFRSKTRLSSWVDVEGGDCCRTWKGVKCNSTTGNVVVLDLAGNCSESDQLQANELDPSIAELKHLKYLDLSCNEFSGSPIPQFVGSLDQLRYLNLSNSNFEGEIPPELGNLTQLRSLDLEGFEEVFQVDDDFLEWLPRLERLQFLNLGGTNLSRVLNPMKVILQLPSLVELRLANCQLGLAHHDSQKYINTSKKLQILDLSQNSFQGPIPHFLVNLSSLSFLDLSSNFINHSHPGWQLGKNIQHLDLSSNQLTYGAVVVHVGKLCTLKYLDLSYNDFERVDLGSEINLFTCFKFSLEELHLNYNNITGELPRWLGEFRNLKVLSLAGNQLSNHVPSSLGSLSSLELLDISDNYFHGMINEAFFTNLSSLYYLNLGANFLTLQLSSDWKPPFQLQYFMVNSCKMNTSYPQWLLNQTKLVNLDISKAGIYGPLPENIGEQMSTSSLYNLNMSYNLLSGSIPKSLCKISTLVSLDLHSNNLSGAIPGCLEDPFPDLSYIDLSSNKLSGPFPNWLTNVTTLELLKLNNNSLEGDIPSLWRNSAILRLLDVGENNLSGNFSKWENDTDFLLLQILRIRDNRISGTIPTLLCSLAHLQVLDLASNNISGTVPPCLGDLEGMISVPQENIWGIIFQDNHGIKPRTWNFDDVYEVLRGQSRQYSKSIRFLVNIDISNNNLVGSFPSELTNLSALIGLNLSNNHLTGGIPKELGNLKALESLDLSRNNFSGIIPQGLSALTSLARLNLSYNHLHGQIPSGSQLQTLDDPSMYVGNLGLCGDPLPQKCPGHDAPQKASPKEINPDEDDSEEKHWKLWLYLIIMCGLATGFWGVIGTLVVNRRWRHAYFRFADFIADWIYVRISVNIARLRRKLE